MIARAYSGLTAVALLAPLGCSGDAETLVPPDLVGDTAGEPGRTPSEQAPVPAQGGTGGFAGAPSVSAGSGGQEMGGSAEVVDLTVPLSEVENPLRVREGCPEVQVEPFSGQQWAIVSLNLLDPEMIIQNVSGRSLELTTDQQWCSFPKYERLIPLDVADPGNIQRTEFAPGEILRVKLVESDRVEGERVDPIRFDPSGGEMGLYRGSGTYRNIEDIFAFISWRDGNPTEGREMVASGAGIWALGERVEIEPGWGGIIAVGDPRVATGFRSVPLACLPLRDGQEE